MTLRTGTHDIGSLIAVENQSILDYGLDQINAALQADRDAHNAVVQDMTTELAEVTTERALVYGASTDGEMVEADEYGRAPTQVEVPGAPIGLPLKRYQYAIGWTNDYMLTRTPADMARSQLAAENADLRAIQTEFQRAIFGATNLTVRDRLVDNYPLDVKRFVNADSAVIPNGPNGETFDGATHTHYDVSATLSAAALTTMIGDVLEHGHGLDVRLYINTANQTTVEGLTGYLPYTDPRTTPAATAARANGTLDITRANNRAIGLFGAAEVWVKPWVPANYVFAFSRGDGRKPLAYRQPVNAALRGLRVAAENAAFPLYARFMERRFGIGARTRTNGAALFIDAGGVYVSPTF